MLSRLKISHKLLWINFVSILTVLLLTSVIKIYENFQTSTLNLKQRIESQGKLVANNSLAAVMFADWDEVKVILSSLDDDKAIILASIVTDTEMTSVDLDNIAKQTSEHWYHPYFYTPKTTSISLPVLNGNQQLAVVNIRYRDNELQEAICSSLSSSVALLLFALTMGVFLSLRMQTSITKPLHKLSETTRKVSQTKNYSLRGLHYYPDEIGSLTNDFNAMLEIIEQRDQHLEQEVLTRTSQLNRNYEELKIQIQKREQTEKANRDIQKRFEQAFLNAPIGMALVNAELDLIQYNSILADLLDIEAKRNTNLTTLISDFEASKIGPDFARLASNHIDRFEKEFSIEGSDKQLKHLIASFSSVNDDQDTFQYAVLQMQDITEAKKLAQKLHYQANHDSLTGLANRRVIKDTLTKFLDPLNSRDTHTLCILDLDQFKIVNDTCGHAAGDEMLCQLARLIEESVRDGDIVARLGGDEFALLLQKCDRTEAELITENIRAAIEHWEFNWQAQTFRVGVSIGAILMDGSCKDPVLLMQQADSACFLAKDMGRNRVYILKGGIDSEIDQRRGEMRWVQRIHEATEKNHFALFAQPVTPINALRTDARCEILVRMRDVNNEGEYIPPGAFLPAAERYGISSKIDRWVISNLIEALQDNTTLNKSYANYWVNLSGCSLSDPSFISFLEETMSNSKLRKGLINFEITETVVMKNAKEFGEVMSRLKSLGCEFALDDFGSGASSFGYLKHLPVDYLKIDGMFVRDILHDEIDLIFVKSIIDIAKVMGLKTVAEFVESEAIFDKLKEIGTDYGQGYALGYPEPLLLDEVEKSTRTVRSIY